jgi:Lsm interaction motif
MDQKEFMDKTLTVAISCPPAHDKTAPVASQSTSYIPTQRSDQKTRILFVPASVQKATSSTKEASNEGSKLSNEDFRKMLLK